MKILVLLLGCVSLLCVPTTTTALITPSSTNKPYGIRNTQQHRPPSWLSTNGGSSSSSTAASATVSATDDGGSSSGSVGGGTATIPNEVFNLIKCIVGSGVLSLPWGIAVYGNAPSALLPAVAFIGIMGIISGYTFQLIGRVCQATNTESYADAWDKTVGPKLKFIIAFSCFIDCFAGNLSYSMILADTFQSLLQGFAGIALSRTTCLLGVTGLFLLPLCLLKELSSLAPFSLVGILGMLYTTVAMGIRYFGKAYKIGGKFHSKDVVSALPSFGTAGASSALSPKSLILMCMLSNAYIAHFSAPKFLSELKNNTIGRFNQVIAWSFGTSVALYAIISAFGFLTFGAVSNGFILNNYASKDLVMGLSRIAVALSIVFSYPLLFHGTRDGLLDVLEVKPSQRSNALMNKFTVGIMAVVTAAAAKLTDLGLVASVGGATFGTALVFVYPGIMFIKSQKGKKSFETKVAGLIACLGVVMGAIGTVLSFQ